MAGGLQDTVPGQFDDAVDEDAARPSTSERAGPSKQAVGCAPSDCATRTRTEDARDAACALRDQLSAMDPGLLRELVRARQTAAGIVQSFPEGDQRFASIESDDDGDASGAESDSDALNGAEQDDIADGSCGVADEGDSDPCLGLLDKKKDPGPRAALERARREYGFDLVAEMERGALGTFARIRLANFVRRRVIAGDDAESVVRLVRDAVDKGTSVGVLADDALLLPVVPGDVLLTVLEDFDVETDDTEVVADAVRQCLEIEKLTQ